MTRDDYHINEHDSRAKSRDPERWAAARTRTPAFEPYWDLRLDPENAMLCLVRDKASRAHLLDIAPDASWQAHLAGGPLVHSTFRGYVRRILQNKDKSYYVELKDATQPEYDHETGWFGFTAPKANRYSGERKFRYLYEPYLPGSLLEVEFVPVPNGDGGTWRIPLAFAIERVDATPVGKAGKRPTPTNVE